MELYLYPAREMRGTPDFPGIGEWSHFLMSSRRVLAFHAFHEKGEGEGEGEGDK